MSSVLEIHLYNWPKSYIRDQDIQAFFQNDHAKRYDAVKYAFKKGILIKIKRGLYAIKLPGKKINFDPFEIAQALYGPCYISLESALSYHSWIPEAVYTTTCATIRRSKRFKTSIGHYNYAHTPLAIFYNEVVRVQSGSDIYLMANPWKALADFIYTYKKDWRSIEELSGDLRIEVETLEDSDLLSLSNTLKHYNSNRVAEVLKKFLKELKP